ncbi:crotonase/enoyl-CoA hydratase family protein [Amycolatopsis sp. GM8]|uniref:crotonase/enoyl-CoA hydratase family protein n=1 Tax=Amycolatopsis sp. GM8 TaxID=2896530 RepID=UPI001F263DF1|nr:crotonase/enoyl-CoA hydratase family protein [Amycolatopsis sp. GM8]
MNNDLVVLEVDGPIATITLNRPERRNAFSRAIADGLDSALSGLPDEVRAVVLAGTGDHFCAGLDLKEHEQAAPFEAVKFSRSSQAMLARLRNCGRPVIAALQGAVIGGGLEIACQAHVRVADETAFFELPEGRRGIFVGGGASVSVAKIIGTDRLIEMMLTGRRYEVREGERLGLVHYVVEPGKAMQKALEIARTVIHNAPISNYMILHALQEIGEMPASAGYFTESLAQAMTLTSEDARAGMEAFLRKRSITF